MVGVGDVGGRLYRQRRSIPAEVVSGLVAGDAQQPGDKLSPAPVASDALQRRQEGLRGQVLGVVDVPDPDQQVTVDAVHVAAVESGKGSGILRSLPGQRFVVPSLCYWIRPVLWSVGQDVGHPCCLSG